jgi:hypothetical protein
MTYWYNQSMDEFHLFAEFARQEVQPTLYSYNVLRVATKDFHHNNKLGQGGFGVVYKIDKINKLYSWIGQND